MYPGPVGALAVYMRVNGNGRRKVWERYVKHGGTGITGRWLQGEILLTADVFPITEVR